MPHLARIVIIAFALVATSCSAERAQQELERKEKEIGQELTAAYTNVICLDVTNNGRSQQRNRSGFQGLPNRRIEASSI